MTDSQRLKDLLWIERDELQAKVNTLETELDRLTAVHQFDPDDKRTWPEDGAFVWVNKDYYGTNISPALFINCNPWETVDEFFKFPNSDLEDQHVLDNLLWSEHAPSLQTHLKTLTLTP